MPTNITIIRTEDFIRAAPDGTLNLVASQALLADLVSGVEASGVNHILVDTRGAVARLSTTDLYEIGAAVAIQPTLRSSRVAILVPPEEEANAGFFEDVAQNRGANLRAFTEFEPAITWLIMREES